MISLIIVLFIVLLVVMIVRATSNPQKELHNHWNVLMYGMNHSTIEFYNQLKEDFREHNVESMTVEDTDVLTGNAFSHKRKYLRVSYREFTYDICGAPFGKSFFVSYWMYATLRKREYVVLHIPFVGARMHRFFFPKTFYHIDTSHMFHTLIHDVMMERVDALADGQKLARLSANQKIPNMKNVFVR